MFDRDDLQDDPALIVELLDDDSDGDAPLTERLARWVADMEHRYPYLDADPDGSPWASWPLTQSCAAGTCCALNIVWSAVDRVVSEVVAHAQNAGLEVFDPQSDALAPRVVDDRARRAERRWRRRAR